MDKLPDKQNHLAASFIRSEQNPEDNNPDFWAYEQLLELALSSPHEALAVMDIIVDMKPQEEVLQGLGAGPFEDMLRGCNNPQIFDAIHKRVEYSHGWRTVIGNVWTSGFVNHKQAERLKVAIRKYSPDSHP